MQIEVENARKMLGQRIRDDLRRRYGPNAAKHAARLTGSDLRTARGWVEEGREPKGEALLAIIRDMGRDGLLALFSPEIEKHEEYLERQIDDLRGKMARLEAQLGKGRAPAADHITGMAPAATHDRRVNQDRDRRGRSRPGLSPERS